MKSAGKARNNGLYRHIRTSKEIIRNLLNDYTNCTVPDIHLQILPVSKIQQESFCCLILFLYLWYSLVFSLEPALVSVSW